MAEERIAARCCIVGGGPAGMMLGLLLARRGIDVVVLEKHADFLRDFRGDTIHPSTLEVMHELGLIESFLRLPHIRLETLAGEIGPRSVTIADFRRLPTHCKFLALMPQWDFLNFLAAEAERFPNFRLLMETQAVDLIREQGEVVGLVAEGAKGGRFEVRAELVIAADGRDSLLRARAGLKVMTLGAPMDVLWMRISRRSDDPPQAFGRIDAGRMMVLLNRDRYWQCAFVIPKGGFDGVRAAGLPAFRETIKALVPWLGERTGELTGWDDVKLLTVAVDRLPRWHRPGLLCIGDAAHAMSPIGGVGINLAIQDAVASANILGPVLARDRPSERDLASVQRRRLWPTAMTQRLQIAIQNRIIMRVLAGVTDSPPPLPVRLLQWFPVLRRVFARVMGMGFRPEHVRG